MKAHIEGIGELEFKLVDCELAFKEGEAKPFRLYQSVDMVFRYAWIGLVMIVVDDKGEILRHWHTLDTITSPFEIVEKIPEDELSLMVKRQKAFT